MRFQGQTTELFTGARLITEMGLLLAAFAPVAGNQRNALLMD